MPKYEAKDRSPSRIVPAFIRRTRLRSKLVSPVRFPLHGPIARSRKAPVARLTIVTNRAKGNPTPGFWPAGCGKARWLAGVSGIEADEPSTMCTSRPFQSQSARDFPSASSPSLRTKRTMKESGRRCRALQ